MAFAVGLVVLVVAASGCRRVRQAPADAAVADARAASVEPRVPAVIEQPSPAPPTSFDHIVERLAPSLVNIQASTKVRGGPASMYPGASLDSSLGTGFIVDRTGYVLTNYRIVRQAPELSVVLSDVMGGGAGAASYKVTLVGWDEQLDVAMLRIEDPPSALRPAPVGTDAPLPLGRDVPLQVGEWVVALGAPFPGQVTAHPGVISALPRPEDSALGGAPPHLFAALAQTDALIHEGNTGGPLVDLDGNVVGLSVMGKSRDGRIGFAVPIDRIRLLWPALASGGQVARSWLGVYVVPVTAEIAEQRSYPAANGAYVTEVLPGGPAARAGIRVGDIIERFGGQDVTDRNLPFVVQLTPPGTTLDAVVWRAGASQTLRVTLEKTPK